LALRILVATALALHAPPVTLAPGQLALPASEKQVSSEEEGNKALARGFYEDLWFSDHTDRYDRYVAPEYILHDVGDDKNIKEPAVRQKEIADFLRSQGTMTGTIDFQIAEGDLVATRWEWNFKPTSLMFRLLGGREQIPIINVFRFRDGKIVEIWNHRHDVDTARGNIPFVQGLALGLLLALFGWVTAFVLWRRIRAARVAGVAPQR